MHRDVVFDANSSDAFHVHARLYGNHISSFESNRLPPGYPRLFMHFQPQTMSRAVHEVLFEAILSEDFPCSLVHRGTGCSGVYSANGGLLRFQNCPIPLSDAPWRPAHM